MSINNLSDCHIHCNFSSDSSAKPEDMIEQAIFLGLKSITFTDHNDFNYPLEDGQIVFDLNFNDYISKISQLKELYSKKIDIRIGVEQGLQSDIFKKINEYDASCILDFIIGSSHLVDGNDPYYPEFWVGRSIHNSIINYYENIEKCIQTCSNFDVYGHLDYIIRYSPDKDSDYNPYEYMEIIDAIFKNLINKGKGIEINTAGLKYSFKECNPCMAYLKRYRELGGEIITIGSDAHKPKDLAYSFSLIPDILKESGFDYYTIFKKRKPEFIKL